MSIPNGTRLISICLKTINRPETTEWTSVAQNFLDMSFNRVMQKLLDFMPVEQTTVFVDEKLYEDSTNPEIYLGSFDDTYIELFVGPNKNTIRIQEAVQALESCSWYKNGIPEGVCYKIGYRYFFNKADVISSSLNLMILKRTQLNINQDTGKLITAVEVAWDYLYNDLLMRLMIYINDTSERIALQRTLRDEAYLDLQNYWVKLSDTGILQVEG